MVKCYIALAESEDGLKGKGKVFLVDEEIYSELQKFIDKYGHHIESIQISEIK